MASPITRAAMAARTAASRVLAFAGRVVDPDGIPFDRAVAETEISRVNSISARPPYAGHLAFGMDPGRLGGIIRAADAGNTQQWFILAEEIEELYPHYAAVLSKRKRQVTQLPIRVEAAGDDAASKAHAAFVEAWLETEVFQDYLFHMADAIGKGASIGEIMWETKPGCFRPREILWRHQKDFEISWEDGETIWLRDEGGFLDLVPHKFLVHKHPFKSGRWVRSGLTRAVSFMWMYAAFNLKDWALFCQAYGFPIRVGRYGPEASETDKRVLWHAVASIAGDVAATIPKSVEIEFVKDGDRAAGSTLFEKRADWLDRSVSKLVLGGTAGTDAISGGHAVGKEHRSAEQDVERFDARLIGVTATRQLVAPMIAFTFGPQDAYPVLKLGQEEKVPLADVISAVADLGGMGLKVRASQLYERLDLTPPEGDEPVVGGMPPAPEPAPDIPRPAVKPPELNSLAGLRSLILMHTDVPEELMERMCARLAGEAEGALAGMTGTVRGAFDAAHDMADLRRRLDALDLPKKEYAEAMARGMSLAELVGQASVMAELGKR